jgi:hypothetical protein
MVQSRGFRVTMAALCAAVITLIAPRVFAQTVDQRGNVTVDWEGQPIITITLTPNYHSGYGAVRAVIGTQPTPVPGPHASPSAGSVDFGNVLAGANYLYKYAVHLNVKSNASTGVDVYGEAAADFKTQTDANIMSATSLYWLNSTNGSDSNTGFSPSIAFMKTNGMVSGFTYTTPPTISYTTYPSPISTSTTGNADFYYDYQLKVPPTAAADDYYVWVVYTVLGK